MADNIKQIIGQRINTVLAIRNIKQKDLANAIGVSDNIISYYVSGKRTPNTEQIIAISKYLDVSSDYLLGLSDVQSANIELKAICNYMGLPENTVEKISQTMQRVIRDDNTNIDQHITSRCYCLVELYEKGYIERETAAEIADKIMVKLESINKQTVYNHLFTLFPEYTQFLDCLYCLILAKLEHDYVLYGLRKEIKEAETNMENAVKNNEFPTKQVNDILLVNDNLKNEYQFRRWILSDVINRFCETLVNEILGENNADD